jgi:hypothetical protein
LNAEILRCVSRRVRTEANAKEKASAHFAQDNSWVVREGRVLTFWEKRRQGCRRYRLSRSILPRWGAAVLRPYNIPRQSFSGAQSRPNAKNAINNANG